jgi:5-methylcytosine-specific restriction endonuclease McrA
MNNIVDAKIVRRLNANWMRIGWSTVAEAIIALCGGNPSDPPALAMDIDYERDAEGNPIYEKMIQAIPTKWEDWIKLPVRKGDMSIRTSTREIRVPTVIVCPKYKDMPIKELRPTKTGIRARDKNRCQYTGVELTNKTASIDHVLPRSKGGKDTWENLVLCHKDVNSKKGNKLNKEIGLKLLKTPTAPRAIPVCELITEVRHPDHQHF